MEKTNNPYQTATIDLLYPTLNDIHACCRCIANGIDDLSPMLSKEETSQLKILCGKWMYNLRKHKEDTINGMIEELSQ